MEGIDKVYNFGLFDFNTPNFVAKFVKGNLLYHVDVIPYRSFIQHYVYDNRQVDEQFLNLTLAQKQEVFDRLNVAILEENKFYLYKFIDDNCTTKVADILNEVTDDALFVDFEENKKTYREILSEYTTREAWVTLGINLLIGNKGDHDNTKLFLPEKLMMGIAKTSVGGESLVDEHVEVYRYQRPDMPQKVPWWNTFWFYSVMMIVLAVLAYKLQVVRNILSIVYGVLGLFFIGIAMYSTHSEFLYNSSVLLFSPLFLVLVFLRGAKKGFMYALNIILLSLFLYIVFNITSIKLILTLPLLWVALIVVLKERFELRKAS